VAALVALAVASEGLVTTAVKAETAVREAMRVATASQVVVVADKASVAPHLAVETIVNSAVAAAVATPL